MNQKLLEDFTKFCNKHPNLIFWQSLRAWAGVGFIYTSKSRIECADEDMEIEDTFYWTDKTQ